MGDNVVQLLPQHDATTEDDKVVNEYASAVPPRGQPLLKSEHLNKSPKVEIV